MSGKIRAIKEFFVDCPETFMGFLGIIALIAIMSCFGYLCHESSKHPSKQYLMGHEAFELGLPANSNPYKYEIESENWLRGYMDAKKKSN